MNLPIAFFLIVVGVPFTAIGSIFSLLIWTYHRRKMEEIRLKQKAMVAQDVQAEFAHVRAEIQALRDTSMQYDLSFDSALQRMERRMEQVEARTFGKAAEPEQQNVSLGSR